jgi:hypothetical protein
MPSPDTVRLTIPVAYNVQGQRVGGLNLDDESVGFRGQYSPFMKNMIVESTKVRKRQGYSRLGTGAAMSGIGSRLVSYIDAQGARHLIAFTTTDAYLYNSTNDTWDEITEVGSDWSGDADDRFSTAIVTDAAAFVNNGGSALCVVNNVDDVKYLEGTGSDKFAVLAHTFPSFSSCKEIIEFWNHFMLLNYTDTATRARGLAFAATGDIDDWTSAVAGATTLTDTQGEILRAAKLGSDMLIYSENTISRCAYVGGSTIFAIPVVVQESGLIAPNAVVELTKTHFFLGTDQIVYSFDRSGGLSRIGVGIEKYLFNNIAMDLKTRIAAGHDIGRKKIMFFIPTSGDDYASKAYATNIGLAGHPWEYHEFAHNVRDMATLRRTKESIYCDDAVWGEYYVDELTIYCDDLYGQEGFDMACFITDTGYVYTLDEATGYDDESDIVCEYQTEDFVLGDEEDHLRALWFSFTAMSQFASISAFVFYSTDGGETFTQLVDSPVTLEENWKTHRLPLDVLSRRIRFRITQNGYGDLQLRSNFRVEAVPCDSAD